MFGFRRISQYEKDYLYQKKSTLEDLLEIKNRFEKWCLEYDEEFTNLLNSYKSAQNTDYIGLALKRNRRLEKSMEETINEALMLQQRDLSALKEKMILEFNRFINTQLQNNNAKYHTLFTNIYESEKEKYYNARAFYKELDSVDFIQEMEDMDKYLMGLNMIYSNFLAKEYPKINQVR